MIEIEEMNISLEDIEKILTKKVEVLSRLKKSLDTLLKTLNKINELEKTFFKKLGKVKNTSLALTLFFDGVGLEELQKTIRNLKELEQEAEKDIEDITKSIDVSEPSEETLENLYKKSEDKLNQWIKKLDNISNDLESIFTEEVSKINKELDVLERLIDSILRKVESSGGELNITTILNEEFYNVKQIRSNIPMLENLIQIDMNELRGLYNRVRDAIGCARSKIRDMAIKNNLLSEDEIKVLEALIEENIKDLDIKETINILKTKLNIDEERVRHILLDLSEDGFITMKVSVE